MARSGWKHKGCGGEIVLIMDSTTFQMDEHKEPQYDEQDYSYECEKCGFGISAFDDDLENFAEWGEL